jgi:hypothetical protein
VARQRQGVRDLSHGGRIDDDFMKPFSRILLQDGKGLLSFSPSLGYRVLTPAEKT